MTVLHRRAETIRTGWLVLLTTAVLAAGCASPQRQPQASTPAAIQTAPLSQGPWTGRLALKVETDPPQSFFASFDLSGNAQSGQLLLTGPLGSTAAQLAWAPGRATLTAGKEVRTFASLGALIAHVTGTPVPAEALFEWLNGREPVVPGWRVDLSRRAEGRIVARRDGAPQPAELRIILQP